LRCRSACSWAMPGASCAVGSGVLPWRITILRGLCDLSEAQPCRERCLALHPRLFLGVVFGVALTSGCLGDSDVASCDVSGVAAGGVELAGSCEELPQALETVSATAIPNVSKICIKTLDAMAPFLAVQRLTQWLPLVLGMLARFSSG